MQVDIILFSDLHFHPHEVMSFQEDGVNSRLNDSYNVLIEIKNYALQNNINQVFFLGDFFHTRSKIDINVYNFAYVTLEEFYEDGITLHLLAGNHDMYFRNTAKVTSLRPLSRIANVINKPTFIKVGNVDFVLFPYYEKPQKFKEAIDSMDYSDKENLTFLLHTEYKGALRNALSSPVKTGIDMSYFPSKTYKVYMGHYHMKQQVEHWIHYLGSPIQVSMREITEQKYFYVMNTIDTSITPVVTSAPKFAIVEYPSKKILKYWDKDASLEEAIKGNYVEVRAFETIKKSTYFHKMLQKARNYIVSNKIESQEEINRTADDMELNIDDIEPLIDRYVSDHPFEKGTPQILDKAKNIILEAARG
jgi:DNA repair exonuclease SbcCD nuclease subunit